MSRKALRLSAATAVAAMLFSLLPPGAGARRQRLQLVRLYRRVDPRRLHQGDRHQGRLRRLRHQRDPRDQAARRRHRLRRRRADRPLPRPPDQGRRLPEARQVEAAEPLQHVGRGHRADRRLRSRQRIFDQLHVGHDRHRLQRQQDARSAARHRHDRQLGRDLQAGDRRQAQRTAASTCSIRRTTSFRRR